MGRKDDQPTSKQKETSLSVVNEKKDRSQKG